MRQEAEEAVGKVLNVLENTRGIMDQAVTELVRLVKETDFPVGDESKDSCEGFVEIGSGIKDVMKSSIQVITFLKMKVHEQEGIIEQLKQDSTVNSKRNNGHDFSTNQQRSEQ